jgi:hypothetical protein
MIDRQSILKTREDPANVMEYGKQTNPKRTIVVPLMHILCAMVVSSFIGVLVLAPILSTALPHRSPRLYQWMSGALSPIFLASGFFSGLLINSRTHSRSACWVWAVGLLWSVIAVQGSVPYRSRRHPSAECSVWEVTESSILNRASANCGSLGDTALLGITPAVTSIGYSLGSWVALRLRRTEGRR